MPVTPLFISKTSARLDMRFHIQNVGKSVASSVKLIAELHILADYQSWRKNNSICDRARAERVEVSIIPNTTFFTDRKVAVIPDAEWDEYENMVRRGAGSDSAVLFLDTCIHYADGRNEHQYTRLGFVMLKKVAEKEVPFSTANVETVPADVLSFTPLSDVIRAN